jgi:hypothetical protein
VATEIYTIKDLREAIKDLPEDMLVKGYKGGNGDLYSVGSWIISKDTLTEEEIKGGYPEGVIPTFVIDMD